MQMSRAIAVVFGAAFKIVAVLFGAWVGYIVGALISFYAIDGDVGSAAFMYILCPLGALVCSIGAFVLVRLGTERWL